MNTQFTALRLAEALEAPLSAEWMKEVTLDHIVAELRRLHEVNQELVGALENISHMADCSGDLAILDEANSALIKAGEK